jgi:hypothetical protein
MEAEVDVLFLQETTTNRVAVIARTGIAIRIIFMIYVLKIAK